MILSFDEESHKYMIDGIPAVSVSKIATQVTGKSYANVDPIILEVARVRGENIHSDVEHNTCDMPESKWVSEQIHIPGCYFETRIGGYLNQVPICGRADVIDETNKTIFDIKTGSSIDRLYWTIQLNLYRELLLQTTGFNATSLAVLWTPKNGKYKVVEIQILSHLRIKELIDAYKYNVCINKTFLEKDSSERIVMSIEGKKEEIESVMSHLMMMTIHYEIQSREEL